MIPVMLILTWSLSFPSFVRHYDEEDMKPSRPPPPDEEPEKGTPFAGLLHCIILKLLKIICCSVLIQIVSDIAYY